MAASGEEEVDYESDPEEAKRSLTMRRREASDDEEEIEGDEERERKVDSRAVIESDGESDGQGAPAEYEEEELEMEEEELEDYGEEEVEEEEVLVVVDEEYELRGGGNRGEVVETVGKKELEEERGREIEGANQVDEEGEKKENEPFAVPTAGAFYMHDDRFRGNVGGRNRRTFVGKRLWESKDERKWGHDKFEEITVQDRHYEEGARNSRGRYRAREKSRGADRGYPSGGNKSRAYNNNNQNQGPKSVRGRGPRRYEPSQKNYGGAPPMPNKKSGKPIEKTLHDSSEREPMASSNSKSDPTPFRMQMFASSLNSASPPFYPSSSSNKEPSLTPKRDEKAMNRNLPNSNTMVRGKSVVGSVGMEKLNINDSASAICGKPSTTSQLPFSGSSSVKNTQPLQSRAQGRGVAPHNQVNRASPPTQLHNVQRNPVQTRVQPSLQASIQQLGQSPGSGSQTSSPPKTALSMMSFQPTKVGSPSESGKSNTALVGKGRGGIQASGRGSFPYGGAQVMGASGNMGSGHGDPNFAFLPVMPFGGQHPGLPAVGMAFPGYVGQPQLGMGNSEMAWLPVLAGAAGALGAAYCSPYLAVDGAYHSRPSGQTSSSGATSKENNGNKPNNELKPSQRSEAASDEFGQRQKNTRRYTEMNFGQ